MRGSTWTCSTLVIPSSLEWLPQPGNEKHAGSRNACAAFGGRSARTSPPVLRCIHLGGPGVLQTNLVVREIVEMNLHRRDVARGGYFDHDVKGLLVNYVLRNPV